MSVACISVYVVCMVGVRVCVSVVYTSMCICGVCDGVHVFFNDSLRHAFRI